MASSSDIYKIPVFERAVIINHMLHGPGSSVKDVFKFVLAGAVEEPMIFHMSEAAHELLRNNGVKFVHGQVKNAHYPNLIVEHVVPTEVLYKWLLANKNRLSINDIAAALRNCPIALITKEEDAILREKKLTKTMDDPNYDIISGKPFSRYDAAGIKIIY